MSIFPVKIDTMYPRILKPPAFSFFLFGPRGTGKTTWLRENFKDALWFNLLIDKDYLRLAQDLSTFSKEVLAYPKDGWIVIDEIQKLPSLLNEVQNIISESNGRYKFAISGSSARKLRRLNINLLPGRVIQKKFFPLSMVELGSDFNIEQVLSFGTLPFVWNNLSYAEELLLTYVSTYIKEEIHQEALVKDIVGFTRFLKVCALLNGNIVNFSSVARDCGVNRKTVERYFEILSDTLIGIWLYPWEKKPRVKEVTKPKFYLFDCGVIRAAGNRIGLPIEKEERGRLLETYLLGELRNYLNLKKIPGELSFWRSASGAEVDFIWSLGTSHIGIEVKASNTWKRVYSKTLKSLLNEKMLSRGLAVYLGERPLKDGNVD
ncbi:MAG: ATP-binding protein, partial [Candidatus Dadabacteria bacterium]